jgi:hypothetical protein
MQRRASGSRLQVLRSGVEASGFAFPSGSSFPLSASSCRLWAVGLRLELHGLDPSAEPKREAGSREPEA